MRTTMDSGGRVVIPSDLRRRLGLATGSELEVIERDGAIELLPAAMSVGLEESPHGLVATTERDVPPLDADTVRATVENHRR